MISAIAGLLARNGSLITESTSAAVAIISGSFLLYGLARDYQSRVARAFSALLLFVTITYFADLGVSFSASLDSAARRRHLSISCSRLGPEVEAPGRGARRQRRITARMVSGPARRVGKGSP